MMKLFMMFEFFTIKEIINQGLNRGKKSPFCGLGTPKRQFIDKFDSLNNNDLWN